MKTVEREYARRLRLEGRSMKEIARTVGVSLSSVSCWVRDIRLTEEQCRRLLSRNPSVNGQLVAEANRERALVQRRAYQAEGRELARRGSGSHQAGCMLYWAEGSKSRNSIQFVNSDPEMVRFFVEFLRRTYALPDKAFRLDCNLFADHVERQYEIERFWLDTLQLPGSCLRKSTVNVYSKFSKKKRKKPAAVRDRPRLRALDRVIQSIYGAIQEYGGFDRPEWLG